MSIKKTIAIIYPAGQVDPAVIAPNLAQLRLHFTVKNTPCSRDFNARLQQLMDALLDDDNDIILAARGGYGCSDLLPHLPWEQLASQKPKTLVGLSDISALLAAFYHKTHWLCIHGPMPGSPLWGKNSQQDIEQLIQLLQATPLPQQFALTPLLHIEQEISGYLFGGCFSVLTNLIGTEYLPHLPEKTILFLEDINETTPRLLRYFNQWQQAGLLDNVSALLLGNFMGCGPVAEQFAARGQLPTYLCDQFGHISPNLPISLGARFKISDTNGQILM